MTLGSIALLLLACFVAAWLGAVVGFKWAAFNEDETVRSLKVRLLEIERSLDLHMRGNL